MSAASQKKPINRKFLYIAIGGIVGLGALGVISLMVNDPRKQQEVKREVAKREELEKQPVGSEESAVKLLDAAQREIDRTEKKEKARETAFDDLLDGGRGGSPSQGGGTSRLNAQQLRDLDELQKLVGASPELAAGVPPSSGGSSGVFGGNRGGGAGAGAKGLVYDEYDKKPIIEAAHDTLFGEQDRAAGSDTASVYETIKPSVAPSALVINQGAAIQAVLMTSIDTRKAGPIKAMVTRTMYDSRTQRVPLIPQGSQLMGSYISAVNPGDDKVEVNFKRLILPDGRSFDLPSFPTSGGDGTIGVDGRYHSNFIRAIGPSFVVAVLGQAIDRQLQKEIEADRGEVQPGMGGVYQSPSVLEQVTPKVNEVVMKRNEGVKPYFTVKPGAPIRVIVEADMDFSGATGGVAK